MVRVVPVPTEQINLVSGVSVNRYYTQVGTYFNASIPRTSDIFNSDTSHDLFLTLRRQFPQSGFGKERASIRLMLRGCGTIFIELHFLILASSKEVPLFST